MTRPHSLRKKRRLVSKRRFSGAAIVLSSQPLQWPLDAPNMSHAQPPEVPPPCYLIRSVARTRRMTVSPSEFRKALGCFATGITVITVDHENEVHGMTANAFTSVSLDPMLVLVCVDQRARTHAHLHAKKRFGVNVLAEDQRLISEYYARPRPRCRISRCRLRPHSPRHARPSRSPRLLRVPSPHRPGRRRPHHLHRRSRRSPCPPRPPASLLRKQVPENRRR